MRPKIEDGCRFRSLGGVNGVGQGKKRGLGNVLLKKKKVKENQKLSTLFLSGNIGRWGVEIFTNEQ